MSTVYSGTKQPLSFWQIWNMCFGFFGLTRDSGGPVGVRLASKGLVLRRLGNLPPQVTP